MLVLEGQLPYSFIIKTAVEDLIYFSGNEKSEKRSLFCVCLLCQEPKGQPMLATLNDPVACWLCVHIRVEL